MAEIICIECKNSVSDASGFCPECGYPFNLEKEYNIQVNKLSPSTGHHVEITELTPEIFSHSMDSLKREINDLEAIMKDIKLEINKFSQASVDNTSEILTNVNNSLKSITASISSINDLSHKEKPEKSKKEIFSAFCKSLNSPSTMLEYMFYLCVAQITFVIVILFIAAYIVTLIRS